MKFSSFFAFSGVLLLAVCTIMFAKNPAESAVTLLYFQAESAENENKIDLIWETSTELNSAAFYLKRAASPEEFKPVTDLSDAIEVEYKGELLTEIPSEGDGGTGAIYNAVDFDVEDDQTYWYMLVEKETDQSYNRMDVDAARVGDAPVIREVQLAPDAFTFTFFPGETVRLSVLASNIGNVDDSYSADIASLWPSSLDEDETRVLEPLESQNIFYNTDVPATAKIGDSDTLLIRVISQTDSSASAVARIQIVVGAEHQIYLPILSK